MSQSQTPGGWSSYCWSGACLKRIWVHPKLWCAATAVCSSRPNSLCGLPCVLCTLRCPAASCVSRLIVSWIALKHSPVRHTTQLDILVYEAHESLHRLFYWPKMFLICYEITCQSRVGLVHSIPCAWIKFFFKAMQAIRRDTSEQHNNMQTPLLI